MRYVIMVQEQQASKFSDRCMVGRVRAAGPTVGEAARIHQIGIHPRHGSAQLVHLLSLCLR